MQVGRTSDINERISLLASNQFGENNPYGSNNVAAISPKGEGENASGQVGTLIDINTRTSVVAKNKFNGSKAYPDF